MARGFIFKWAVRPMRGIGFDGGFLKKIVGWGATSPLPPTMGNPGQVSQGKSGNLLEDQGKKFLSMQICNFNKKSYASRNVCSWIVYGNQLCIWCYYLHLVFNFFKVYHFYIRNYFTVCKIVLCIWRKIIFFFHHNFMKKGHSKLSKKEPENIP